MRRYQRFSRVTRTPAVRYPLFSLLMFGLATACVDRSTEDDGEERRRRCTFIAFSGVDAEGNTKSFYTDPSLGHTPQLCTCSTEEESLDFSEGGYRDYINELGFEECKRISRAEGWQENSCQESFERNAFGLHYGGGPIPPNPPPTDPDHEWETPLCGEEDSQGGCGVK